MLVLELLAIPFLAAGLAWLAETVGYATQRRKDETFKKNTKLTVP